MSGGASISEVVSDDVASDTEVPDSDVSTTASVVPSVVVDVEVHAPNNNATRTTIDMIVSVFFIFFSFV
jgi:hypothetical protein